MFEKLFDRKKVVLSEKSRRILELLDEALKTQSLDASKYFTPLTENTLLAKKYELPYAYVEGHWALLEPIYQNYATKINYALASVGKRSKATWAYELKSRFVIVREILLRLVALICSHDAQSEKWLGVYIAFSIKINQTDLLINKHGFFNKGKMSKLNLMLADQKVIDELTKTARDFDMRYIDITNLPRDERKKVEEYRDRMSFNAFNGLCKLAKDPEFVEVMTAVLNLAFFKWLAAPDDRECPIMTSGNRF